MRSGVLRDYTRLWWDVRPNPRLGTLEIRIPDQPTELERTKLLVTLVRTLVETAEPRDVDPARRGDYAQNRWAAARFGLDAELVHPDADRGVIARDLARDLLGEEPPEPEAARQLEAGAERAAAELVERTLRSV
jgi:carboxylate-amine ligase